MDNSAQQIAVGGTACVEVVKLFDNQLLTYREVKKYFGICGTELKSAKADGLISFYPAGKRGVRFRVSVITRYILDKEMRMQRRTRSAS
jgi:hypothetical protein